MLFFSFTITKFSIPNNEIFKSSDINMLFFESNSLISFPITTFPFSSFSNISSKALKLPISFHPILLVLL